MLGQGLFHLQVAGLAEGLIPVKTFFILMEAEVENKVNLLRDGKLDWIGVRYDLRRGRRKVGLTFVC